MASAANRLATLQRHLQGCSTAPDEADIENSATSAAQISQRWVAVILLTCLPIDIDIAPNPSSNVIDLQAHAWWGTWEPEPNRQQDGKALRNPNQRPRPRQSK
jgi:hypothetical protein